MVGLRNRAGAVQESQLVIAAGSGSRKDWYQSRLEKDGSPVLPLKHRRPVSCVVNLVTAQLSTPWKLASSRLKPCVGCVGESAGVSTPLDDASQTEQART